MDRKEILEKKRQRLEELRKRREEINLLGTKLTLPLVSAKVSTKVDFAVQVDLPQHSNDNSTEISASPLPVVLNGHVQKFDKAIQTYFEEAEVPEIQESISEPIADFDSETLPQDEAKDDSKTIEETLRDELSGIIPAFRFSDLRMGLKTAGETKIEAKDPFNVASGLSGFLNRQISSVDVCSKFPELILVAYKAKSSKQRRDLAYANVVSSVGLAVIFNTSADPFVPEFFLQCTSEITTIQFEKTNPYRIIGGLKNGRVVIWDLSHIEPSKIAVFPTLQTTTLTSIVERPNKLYIHHNTPIVSILQLDVTNQESSSIISISSDGVVNAWSPNFLAFPKLDSIKLSFGTNRLKDQIFVSTALLIHHSQFLASNDRVAHDPEYRFLNQMIVGTKNGVLYRLSNNKSSGNIGNVFECHENEVSLSMHSVSGIAEMSFSTTSSLLISSHYDWNLRIWDLQKSSLVLTIPTSTIVTGIYLRPNHPHQLMTIGCVRLPDVGACIEFWDFLVKSMGPISSVSIYKEKAQSFAAKFDDKGNRFIVSFDNGEIRIWDIEESKLHSHIEASKNSGVDEALSVVLKV